MPPLRNRHFDIDASIVFQLGEELITDVVQALVELVKNSYDADATFAKVIVNTNDLVNETGSYFIGSRGFILVEDNGIGMNEDTIQKGWLTISKSPKREMKLQKNTTLKGRTPLGDKGLGRLGAQRLGVNIEIFTTPKGSTTTHHVGWSWDAFQSGMTLTQVPLKWETFEDDSKQGTRILISGTRESEQWKGSGFSRITALLSQMLSPYVEFHNFRILGSVNGKELELIEVSERIRRGAQVRYKISFDEKSLQIDGKARLQLLRPVSNREIAIFDELVLADQGEKFFAFLSSLPKAANYSLKRSKTKEWFAEFSQRSPFTEIDKIERNHSLEKDAGNPLSPGPFYAEIDTFDLSSAAAAKQNVFDSSAEYKQHLKNLGGVRIYRDGFGIRVDRDWLGLGKQWTSASSWYGLKPDNTLGYVAITAKANGALIETTDREGFKETPEYRNFLRLFEEFRVFAHNVQEFLKRGWIEFRKLSEEQAAKVPLDATPESLAEEVSKGLKSVATFHKSLATTQANIARGAKQAEESLTELRRDLAGHSELQQQCKSLISDFKNHFTEATQLLNDVKSELANASHLYDVQRVVQGQVSSLRDQLLQSVEAMSLGLTTEVLSHEIANICDSLAARTSEISTYLTRKKIADEKIFNYIEHARSTINGLRRQLGHLAPSLKFARTTRKSINLEAYLTDLAVYHNGRFEGKVISLRVDIDNSFSVKINQGKLTQVIDNLIINSEYWLNEDIAAKRINAGVITVRLSQPFIVVSDNGRGIDPIIESSLFEPFVTCKRNGRGLGLFVSHQLLLSEACHIRVRPRRNSTGRLYQFEIDLAECINDDG